MKVLITSGIFPPDIGGPARMIEQLADDLRAKDIDVQILTFGNDDGKSRAYDVIRASGKFDFLWKIFFIAPKVDIIYTFDLYTAGFLSWLIGKKIFGKKLIVRFAGDSAWESAYNKGKITENILAFQKKKYIGRVGLSKKARGWILRGANRVVAVSEFMKDLAVKIGAAPERVATIYNAVDFLTVASDVKLEKNINEELNLASTDKLIATAGRLVPWKGIDKLILALPEINNRYGLGKVKLLIIGDGPDKSRLEKMVLDNNLSGDVIFTGKVQLDKIFSYYSLADVFVLNSQYEGLSHILLEVMHQRKPIVASDSGGNPEVIENEKNGLLVDYNNTIQLIDATYKMLTEEKWHSPDFLQQCGKSLEKFQWSEVIKKTIQVFNEVNHE